jgi:ADP-ribose pyrophosphatase YjhB (NUDIX family)
MESASPLERPYSVSVSGVVVDDEGRVLVIQRRDNGRWEPPGGVLEAGETIEDGVVREVREETGVEVEVQHLTGVYQNLPRQVIALVFRCRPAGEAVAPETAESSQVRWVDLSLVDTLMVRRMPPGCTTVSPPARRPGRTTAATSYSLTTTLGDSRSQCGSRYTAGCPSWRVSPTSPRWPTRDTLPTEQ